MIKKKYLYYIILLLPSLLSSCKFSDHMWLLISQGKTLMESGLHAPHPMHASVPCMYQDWLLSIIYYNVFQWCGALGIMLFLLLCSFAVSLLTFRLCFVISDREDLSFLISLIAVLYYAVFPKDTILLFFFILIGSMFLLLHDFAPQKPVRNLFLIALVSVLCINMQALFFPLIAMFSLLRFFINCMPSLCGKIQNKASVLYGLLCPIVVLLCSLINPYGKEIYSLLSNYWNIQNADIMSTPDIKLVSGKIFFSLLILVIVLIYLFRQKEKPSFFSGFAVIIGVYFAFRNMRLFPILLFCFAIFLAELLRNEKIALPKIKLPIKPLCILLALFLFCGSLLRLHSDLSVQRQQHTALSVFFKEPPAEKSSVFASPNQAGYLSYLGLSPYIDSRAELYIETPKAEESDKEDCVFEEYCNVLGGTLYYRDFLDKYHFDYLFLKEDDLLYTYLSDYSDASQMYVYEPIISEEDFTLFRRTKNEQFMNSF